MKSVSRFNPVLLHPVLIIGILLFVGCEQRESFEKTQTREPVRVEIVLPPPPADTGILITRIKPIGHPDRIVKNVSEWDFAAYDPKGRLNPFKPVLALAPTDAGEKRGRFQDFLDLGRFKVRGIILADSGNRALITTADGKGHVLKKGLYLVTDRARVTEILEDRVLLEEKASDLAHPERFVTRKMELRIEKPYPEL